MEEKRYYCPNCNKSFVTEEEIKRHFLPCWQRQNPDHKSKPAELIDNIYTKEVNEDVLNFFNSFK